MIFSIGRGSYQHFPIHRQCEACPRSDGCRLAIEKVFYMLKSLDVISGVFPH
jgi:hypothetical protein